MQYFPVANEPLIAELLSRMTLAEKIGQLNQYALYEEHTGPSGEKGQVPRKMEMVARGEVGSVLNLVGAERIRQAQKLAVEETRLGIPLVFAYDVIHGYRTIFPIPLAEAASWNPDLVNRSARVAAVEASAAGLQWTFAPMVDVSRDARWGRVMEGSGEDPYLGSILAAARVQGFQGEDLAKLDTIAACAKHFAAYGFAESGKDYNAVDVSNHTLHNFILPPFKAAAEAGVATFMNGFNSLGGQPVTISSLLQRKILKGDWRFLGPVVSDWNSIGELIDHGVAVDVKHAAALAIEAGSDLDMEGSAYIQYLGQLVEEAVISEDRIDEAVTRLLRLKYALGLFEDPYRYCDAERERTMIGHPFHHAAALEMAHESIVLLKNKNQLLPLAPGQRVLLTGALAADRDTPLGNWRARAKHDSAISLADALPENYSGEVSYLKGIEVTIGGFSFSDPYQLAKDDATDWAASLAAAATVDAVVVVLGETANMSGEARSRADIGLPGRQLQFLQELYAVNQRLILILMTGRPLAIPWESTHIPAILFSMHAGSMSGQALTDILVGKVNPSGRLPMTLPRQVGQLPIYYNHPTHGQAYCCWRRGILQPSQ